VVWADNFLRFVRAARRASRPRGLGMSRFAQTAMDDWCRLKECTAKSFETQRNGGAEWTEINHLLRVAVGLLELY